MLLALVPVVGAVVLMFLTHGDPTGWRTVVLCLLAVAAVGVLLVDDFRRRPEQG
ncbi:hypothetical protein [Kineococcus rhizosphaerae]|uniref:Uncharacterized protein n=1 Tax=Kineococcus rhizosphaerae TaxID=559628 RepID=A0A2T0R4W9_9ACTN|nr:hypothetical protein [Kineococcus rhizosphaerae]PRY15806.1 hypothetical protein CLV37_10415 [Kineococcus rhizosphaerae]